MADRSEFFGDAELLRNLSDERSMDSSVKFLYREHFDFLSRYVVNNSGDFNDAEDIFQEVIISFINLVKAGKFRGESSVKTFLYSMTRNLWLNELKKRERAQQREEKYERAKETNGRGVDMAIESREASTQLMKVIGELGDSCKTILLLFYFENRPMKDIVTAVQYENEQVVRNKKYKCLKKLEELIRGNKMLYGQLKQFSNE